MMLRRLTSVLWTHPAPARVPSSTKCLEISPKNIRSFYTSPILQYPTKKRRKRYPFFWLQDKYRAFYDENLTKTNEEFFQKFLKEKYPLGKSISPLRSEPWIVNEVWRPGITRTGVIGKKLGQVAMWTNKGRRTMTTCLQIVDNHVIRYHPPEEYARIGRPVDRTRYEGLGCIIVGSESIDPRAFTAEYTGLFRESGVLPKKKLTRFFINHESRIEPGTPLLVSHFRPGMYVDVYGKSVEWGKQGVRRRFKMKLGRKTHGATKNEHRVGSIGRGRKWCGPLKGRRMPGHHGGERCIMGGLKVLKINTRYNLIWVKGQGVPGLAGSYINIMDSRLPGKTLLIAPPFPTATMEENSQLETELFDEIVHKHSDPTILFEVTEEERKAAQIAARQYGKAKTAQKVR